MIRVNLGQQNEETEVQDTSTLAPWGITICGIEELEGHGSLRASHVLSILDPDWPVPEAFGSWGEHEKLELRFNDIIEETPGMIPPSAADIAALLQFGRDVVGEVASHLVVHCHAGISRSTASMALILAQALPATSAEQIVLTVHGIREKAWPNLRMIELGDAQLGRGGTLVDAVHRLHRLQIERRPELATYMTDCGRGREVETAAAARPLAA